MKRRGVMLATVPALLALSGCLTGEQVAQTVVNDVSLISSAFAKQVPLLDEVPGISTATITAITGYLADAAGVGQDISGALTATAAQPIVQQIEGDVTALLGIAGKPPVSTLIAAAVPGFGPVLAAASVLLPVIEAGVGLVTTVGAPSPAAVANARAVLAAAA